MEKLNLEEFREILNQKRQEIFDRAKGTKKGEEHGVDPDDLADSMDLASSVTDRTLSMQFKDRERSVLLEIEEAIRRIDSEEYGVCDECDEEIGAGRLRAQPMTTLCVRCKEEEEQTRGTNHYGQIEWGLA